MFMLSKTSTSNKKHLSQSISLLETLLDSWQILQYIQRTDRWTFQDKLDKTDVKNVFCLNRAWLTALSQISSLNRVVTDANTAFMYYIYFYRLKYFVGNSVHISKISNTISWSQETHLSGSTNSPNSKRLKPTVISSHQTDETRWQAPECKLSRDLVRARLEHSCCRLGRRNWHIVYWH